MNAKEMIEAMAARSLWTSPGRPTPWATLYSAIIRDIALKGKEARFVKTEGGSLRRRINEIQGWRIFPSRRVRGSG